METNNTESSQRGVSLVIPARNAGRVLRQCLDAVTALLRRGGFEIILVDDGSTDDTAKIATEYAVKLGEAMKIIQGEGQGPGAARNLGWQSAKNPFIWFIDSDCVAEPDALQFLLSHLDDEGVAGAGGSYKNQVPDSLLACLIHAEIIARHTRMPTEVDYLATFNVVYRRSVLAQTGGFDEGIFNGPGAPGAEDIELAYRIHDAGYRLHFEPRSCVGHFHPTRWSKYFRSQRIHGFYRVQLYLYHRSRARGDAYSGWLDHIQPPLAMLILAAIPLSFWPWLALIPGGLALLLLFTQIPTTIRVYRRWPHVRSLWFLVLGFLRAFARGIGMAWATFTFPFRRRIARRHAKMTSRSSG